MVMFMRGRGKRVKLVYARAFDELERKIEEIQTNLIEQGYSISSVIVKSIKVEEIRYQGNPERTEYIYCWWAIVVYEQNR